MPAAPPSDGDLPPSVGAIASDGPHAMTPAEIAREVFLAPIDAVITARDTRVIDRPGWHQVITPSAQSTHGNEVVFSQIAPSDVERVVLDTVAAYAAHRVPFRWCIGPLTEPADFGAVLDRHGFESWAIRGMHIDPTAWRSDPVPRVEIHEVTLDTLDDYIAACRRGWPESVVTDGWRDDLVRARATGRFHFFTARVEGSSIGTAGYVVKQQSAYLVGGNVLPGYRGRGIYRALVDARLARLAAQGIRLATTQAREATSAPILERFGFQTAFRSRIYKLVDPLAALAKHRR
jgi:GNAT superfamily N-acetyltransferase